MSLPTSTLPSSFHPFCPLFPFSCLLSHFSCFVLPSLFYDLLHAPLHCHFNPPSASHSHIHSHSLLPLSSFPLSFSRSLFSLVFYEKSFFRTLPEIPEDSRTFRFLSLSGSLPSVRALSFWPLSDTLSSVRALSSCLPLGRRSVSLMGRRKALAVEIAPNATLKPLNRQMVQNKVAGRHRDTKGILMRILKNLTGSHFEVCLTSPGVIEKGYCC